LTKNLTDWQAIIQFIDDSVAAYFFGPLCISPQQSESSYLKQCKAALYLSHVSTDSKLSIGIVIRQVSADKLFAPGHVGKSNCKMESEKNTQKN